MDDREIIELFFSRDERAIEQTQLKYGKLCFRIAFNILGNIEDSKECVSDTYLSVWNLIPPNRPQHLSAYIGKIARNRALKKLEYNSAAKRCGEALCSLDELSDCVSGCDSPEDALEKSRVESIINAFLLTQRKEKRNIFIWRYWLFMPISEISSGSGYSESKVKSILFNMRKKLRERLEAEGVEL